LPLVWHHASSNKPVDGRVDVPSFDVRGSLEGLDCFIFLAVVLFHDRVKEVLELVVGRFFRLPFAPAPS
jgi:hypothetical protein